MDRALSIHTRLLTDKTPAQLERLAARCNTAALKERFADRLLFEHQAYREGAHSEQSDSRWNRKWNRLLSSDREDGSSFFDWMEAPPPGFETASDQATRAGLSNFDGWIWILFDAGWQLTDIAARLKTTRQRVARRLMKIRRRMLEVIDGSIADVFAAEVRRRRPDRAISAEPLPRELAEARALLESLKGWETWIIPNRPNKVVVLEDPEAILEETSWKRLPSYTYRQIIRLAEDTIASMEDTEVMA